LRDITTLSFLGMPVYSEGGHGGGIGLVEEYRITLSGLNKFEVQSLFVANNNDILRDIGLGDGGERLLLKLLSVLPTCSARDDGANRWAACCHRVFWLFASCKSER
jgi:predicted DNA-binding transcriptional regulator YafY